VVREREEKKREKKKEEGRTITINCQLSTVNCQLSTIDSQLTYQGLPIITKADQ
ncbi:MAG: hypothetical protein HC942_14910, partial [Microcoleus sp. SU_5_6]|nr:hypothetical protein [Microcoleus sp. SU_5_6]